MEALLIIIVFLGLAAIVLSAKVIHMSWSGWPRHRLKSWSVVRNGVLVIETTRGKRIRVEEGAGSVYGNQWFTREWTGADR